MTAGHFIAGADLALLSDMDANLLIHTRRQFIPVFPGEYLYADNDAGLAVRNPQGAVSFFSGLFIKYSAYQAFFRRKLGFAFRRYLAYQNIAGAYFRADTDNTAFIQIFAGIFGDIRYVAGDLLRS